MIKVLAVDDEAPIRRWLQFCISQLDGFCCVTAASAAEGLELYRREQPEIVLSDIEMPGKSGLEMLREISQSGGAPDLIVLTSHSDFSYARTALQLGTAEYFLKAELTEGTLRELLAKAEQRLQQRHKKRSKDKLTQQRYLQGLAAQREQNPLTREELERQGIELRGGPLLVLHCAGLERPGCAACPDLPGCPDDLEQTIATAFGARRVYSFPQGAGDRVVFFETEKDLKQAAAVLNKVSERLRPEMPALSLGVVLLFDGPASLRQGLAEAEQLAKMAFYESDSPIHTSGTAQDSAEQEEAFQLAYMRFLLNQDFQAAYACVREFLSVLKDRRPADIDAVKRTLSIAVTSYLHFSNDSSEEIDRQAQQSKARIRQARTLHELEDEIGAQFAAVVGTAAPTEGMTTPIRRAIAYMEKNYAAKISLGDMARLVAFSPEYFSRSFSKETGITFVTYLNNLRMKQAVTLLENTTMKVYEIAEAVGFSSLSYFSTAFKKKFGQNPYEYQVSYQKTHGLAPKAGE